MTSNNLFVSLLRLGMVPAGPALSEILRAHAQDLVMSRSLTPMAWPGKVNSNSPALPERIIIGISIGETTWVI